MVNDITGKPYTDHEINEYCERVKARIELKKKYKPFNLNIKKNRDFLVGKRIMANDEGFETTIQTFTRWHYQWFYSKHTSSQELFDHYVFTDGTPIGELIKEERET